MKASPFKGEDRSSSLRHAYIKKSLLIFYKKYDIIYIVSEGSGSATTVLMTRGRYPVAKASQKSWVSALIVHSVVHREAMAGPVPALRPVGH